MKSIPRAWYSLVGVFVAGLLAGWLVLGWGLWPRAQSDALPQDLQTPQRQEYLRLVAESLASSGDVIVARAQLAQWPRAVLAQDLSELQQRLSGPELAQVARLQAIANVEAPGEAAGGTGDQIRLAAGAEITRPVGSGTRPGAAAGQPLPSATAPPASPSPVGTPTARVTSAPTATPVPIDLSKTENILILGIDTRPELQAWRTDTIMVAVIDRPSSQLGIVSIPRDLWVSIPGYGRERINAAAYIGEKMHYPGGGPALTQRTLSDNLGLPTQRYVLIQQQGLVKLVDALHGVTVTLDCPLYERTPDEHSATGYKNFYLPAGKVLLDGATAKQFATYRYLTSDFGRVRRQQQLIWAIRNRALQGDVLPRIPELWQALSDTFTTDLTLLDIVQLASLGIRLQTRDVHAMQLGTDLVQNYTTAEGAEVLLLRDRTLLRNRLVALFGAKPLAEVNKSASTGCAPAPPGFPDLSDTVAPQP